MAMARIRWSKRHAVYLACAAGVLAPVMLAMAEDDLGLRGFIDDVEPMESAVEPAGEQLFTSAIPTEPFEPSTPPQGAGPDLLPETDFSTGEGFGALLDDGEAGWSFEPAFHNSQGDETFRPGTAASARQESSKRKVLGARTDALDEEEQPSLQNERVAAIEGGARRMEDDPFAPLGLRIGTFVVVSELEQGLTSTTNVNKSVSGEEAVLSETALRFRAVSDWSRHRAGAEAYGLLRKTISGEEIDDIEGGAQARLDLDFREDLTSYVLFGYDAQREAASAPAAIVGVEKQPLRHSFEGVVGLDQMLGRVQIGLTGEIQRNRYDDAVLSAGGRISQSDRDSTIVLGRLRGGYEVSPALTPFVELEVGRRTYDEKQDSEGYERSANRLAARAGLALDLSEKLAGEISAGWISENFKDPRLARLSGLALAANLNWSPQRGTMVRLDASTHVEGSTDPGESGSLLYSGTLRLEREMRSNLTGAVLLGASYRDYQAGGHDLILTGQAALTWWLNRYAGLTSRIGYERQTSSLAGRDYDEANLFLGLKLQR